METTNTLTGTILGHRAVEPAPDTTPRDESRTRVVVVVMVVAVLVLILVGLGVWAALGNGF